MPLIDHRTGKLADVPENKELPCSAPTPRHICGVIFELTQIIPDQTTTAKLNHIAHLCRYVPPEEQQPYWVLVSDIMAGIVPPPPEKLKEDWQVKAIACLLDIPQKKCREMFGEEKTHAQSVLERLGDPARRPSIPTKEDSCQK